MHSRPLPVLLGFTTKQIYFTGDRKKFRVRCDKVVDFEPFSDGFGIMRDAQTAKPQSFRTRDGWFAYNLAVNLVQMSRSRPQGDQKPFLTRLDESPNSPQV